MTFLQSDRDMNDVLNEYLDVVDDLHGSYLDAVTGFAALVDEYDDARQRMQAWRPEMPAEAFDGAPMRYATGRPGRPQSRVVHTCTQGEYRQRNAPGGRNHVVIGQMCLAQIYGYWEDCYRARLAEAAGIPKNDVKLDIMNDLRLLRHSITHHRGIALKKVEDCKLLKWFREGDVMGLTPEHFEQLIPALRSELRQWATSAGASAPPA